MQKIRKHIAMIGLVCLALGFPVALRYYFYQNDQMALLGTGPMKSTLYKVEKTFEQEDNRILLKVGKKTEQRSAALSENFPEHMLEIKIPDVQAKAVAEAGMGGDLTHVDSIWTRDIEEGCLIQVILDGPYCAEVSIEDGILGIDVKHPGSVYEQIVVIDPGRYEEQDLCLDVARRVQEKLSGDGIEVVLTRTDDHTYSQEQNASLANDVGADLFVALEMPRSEDATLCGVRCLYNSVFFMPGLGSGELAFILEESVLSKTGAKSLGIEPGDGNVLIDYAQMPVAIVQLGYQSNEKENQRLCNETYRQHLADGISLGIIEAYRQKE